MKKITLSEIDIKSNENYRIGYMAGYNTAVEETNKEIQEATELANRSYQEGLKDGKLPIPGLEKEIAELKAILINVQQDRDAWMNKHFKRLVETPTQVGYNPELDPYSPHARWAGTAKNWKSVISPEMKDLLSKPDLVKVEPETLTKDESKLIERLNRHMLILHRLQQRIQKLEARTTSRETETDMTSKRLTDLEQHVEKLEKHKDSQIIENQSVLMVFENMIKRLQKLESSCIMDKEIVKIKDGVTSTVIITKIK